MGTIETKSINAKTLALLLSIAGALIIGLATVTGSVISGWAKSVEARGISNQERITVLEKQVAAFTERQNYMIELLKQHMERDRR